MFKHNYLLCIVLLLTLAIGCTKEQGNRKEDQSAQKSDDALIKLLVKEGYDRKDIVEFKDRYVVQGDIIFYKKDLEQRVAKVTTEQARSPYLVSPAYRHINVYLNAGSFSAVNLSGILDNVIAAYNAVGSGIQLSRVYSAAAANIQIVQNSGLQLGICGQSGFPLSTGQPFNTVYISEYTLTYYNLTSASQLTLLVAHELGHCVGLRHTNWQPSGESAAIPIPSTPSADGASVMNGGTCGNNWGGFSYYDQVALKALYPVTLGGPDRLNTNEQLLQGQVLRSTDGRFILIMQTDGNLVIYYYNVALWSSITAGNPNINRCVMQGDGNLVLYDTGNVAHWSSNTTTGIPGVLVMQSDGNLVIYQNGVGRWSSNTAGY
ncbi:D-mannose binding lectin [Chitinophaga niastensis]|uniref:D-mannose binding lectin n=1 Tax=Chitinophaga niastensis TaxID=536980 RepID=A0A2P8HPY1_CHINA|nr:M57 family metalloprotease [Chitinophaga niastensis]PSL48279.1 D-mannose binding lectin [Chitinophaga niastensis]